MCGLTPPCGVLFNVQFTSEFAGRAEAAATAGTTEVSGVHNGWCGWLMHRAAHLRGKCATDLVSATRRRKGHQRIELLRLVVLNLGSWRSESAPRRCTLRTCQGLGRRWTSPLRIKGFSERRWHHRSPATCLFTGNDTQHLCWPSSVRHKRTPLRKLLLFLRVSQTH